MTYQTGSTPRPAANEMEALLGKTPEELQAAATAAGLPRFVGKQIADWLYAKRVRSFEEMTNISLRGRETLAKMYVVGRHKPVAQAVSEDGTVKYLFEAGKGQYVEAVYLPEDERATACVSTQAGCKMGCRFCMTGTLGFHAQLTAAEILNQIFEINALHGGTLTNVVYMGEGEPMDNIDEVLKSLQVMTADWGCAWSPKRLTVSTVGFIPGMRRFLEESDCHLAISLHNPFHEERQEIMPAEKAYPIADVLELVRQHDFSRQRRVSFEYICFGGLNDTQRHARETVRILHGIPCRVNLIRYHASPEADKKKFPPSDERQMVWLRDYLTAHGMTATIRRSRGEDILAACGMLVNALQKK